MTTDERKQHEWARVNERMHKIEMANARITEEELKIADETLAHAHHELEAIEGITNPTVDHAVYDVEMFGRAYRSVLSMRDELALARLRVANLEEGQRKNTEFLNERWLCDVLHERTWQRGQVTTQADDLKTISEWVATISQMVIAGQSASDVPAESAVTLLRGQMVKVAATAMAAVESIDRQRAAKAPA